MSFNLLESVQHLFTDDLIRKASGQLGESESSVKKAVSGLIPAVLNMLSEKTTSTAGTQSLLQLAQEQHQSGILNKLPDFFNNSNQQEKSASMLSGLLGETKAGALSDLVAGFSGIRSSTSSSLLGWITSAVLALIGKNSAGAGSNIINWITSLFSSQKNNISKAIPHGLNLGNIFDNFSSQKISDLHSPSSRTSNHRTETESSGSASRILLPLLLLIAAALLAWYLFGKGCGNSGDHNTNVNDTLQVNTDANDKPINGDMAVIKGKIDTLTGDWLYDEGDTISVAMPGGETLRIGKYSTEARLIDFLKDQSKTLDTAKGNWFELTNVHFKTGSSEITESSVSQLKNIVTICKAFPQAQFKLGGYTDSTGPVQKNIAISQNRADAVAAFLKKLGVSPQSFTGTKGYGPEWPIASNTTPEGRAQNRRVAVNVKAK
jgi:outer membrane protein OmpA-like peptidoglycan-associated protein